jgi:hypothetical protein
MNVIKTRLQSLAWDGVKARPAYGLDGDRRKGGVSLVRALMENVGTCRHDAKGRPQWKTHTDRVPMRGTGADQPVVCAGQRLDREGSSPSAARMRGGVSKDGGNASSARERRWNGET